MVFFLDLKEVGLLLTLNVAMLISIEMHEFDSRAKRQERN